jgi:ABC-type multidrug transport system fused ATPase/permease subunit
LNSKDVNLHILKRLNRRSLKKVQSCDTAVVPWRWLARAAVEKSTTVGLIERFYDPSEGVIQARDT